MTEYSAMFLFILRFLIRVIEKELNVITTPKPGSLRCNTKVLFRPIVRKYLWIYPIQDLLCSPRFWQEICIARIVFASVRKTQIMIIIQYWRGARFEFPNDVVYVKSMVFTISKHDL